MRVVRLQNCVNFNRAVASNNKYELYNVVYSTLHFMYLVFISVYLISDACLQARVSTTLYVQSLELQLFRQETIFLKQQCKLSGVIIL